MLETMPRRQKSYDDARNDVKITKLNVIIKESETKHKRQISHQSELLSRFLIASLRVHA